jgi:hypothetical protein
MGMKRIFEAIRGMELAGPRVALALLPLIFLSFLYALSALLGPDALRPICIGMAACYLGAFISLASGWFWARWFATGIGWSGLVMGVFGAALQPESWEVYAFFGALHGAVVLLLMGKKMAARFEMQPQWRERFGMDDYAVVRLGRAVTRGSAALPGLIIMALKPPGPDSALAFVAAGLAVAGLAGLLRLRTWGILALGGAAVAMLGVAPTIPFGCFGHTLALGLPDPSAVASASPGLPAALSLLLFTAALPFARGAVRYYRSLR